MPMGIKTAASFFQRYMNETFKSMINKNCVSVYMDDIVVYSDSVEQHLIHLSEVIDIINERGLKVSLE